MRGFVIILVVLHHAIMAYCTFGHVDRLYYVLSTAPIVDAQRWRGFDLVVKLNDGFFMPLLFLLSGLFVWNGLTRKGPWTFLRGRLLRLGLPFAVAELTIVPLAYYPSFLQAGGMPGFPGFWVETVTAGPWPSGPPWFISILFLFDAATALVFALARWPMPRAAKPSSAWPARCFVVLLAVSVLLYLPLLVIYGPYRWLYFGPIAVQASRVLLYAAYFAAGVALGTTGLPSHVQCGETVAQNWLGWVALALLAAGAFVAARPLYAVITGGLAPRSELVFGGFMLTAYCAAVSFALPALFLRFGGNPGPVWCSLAANSFAIYLLHYPIVTWVQYALLTVAFPASGKGVVTFAIALTVSWSLAALSRSIPGIRCERDGQRRR